MPDAENDPRSETTLPAVVLLQNAPNETEQFDGVILDLTVELIRAGISTLN